MEFDEVLARRWMLTAVDEPRPRWAVVSAPESPKVSAELFIAYLDTIDKYHKLYCNLHNRSPAISELMHYGGRSYEESSCFDERVRIFDGVLWPRLC